MEAAATARDLQYLRHAIALATASRARGKHPFAALIVDAGGEVLAEAGNAFGWPDGDATGHAELLAVRDASRHFPPTRLTPATLYSSAEPCAMCAGAVYWSGLGRVVYALSEARLLTLTGDHPENPTLALPCREVFARGQRAIVVIGPLLEDEAAVPHLGFWR
jgi:tRNA(Arg) A34 adenosine deaminase TadA